jgi:hypothetical protein
VISSFEVKGMLGCNLIEKKSPTEMVELCFFVVAWISNFHWRIGCGIR